jgi:hypothetical protein
MDGQCLCGAITISVPETKAIAACHCGMCRRWGGGPYLAVHCGSELQVTGAEKLKTYRSSEWAERAFCSECGTHLFYRLIPTNEYFPTAGLFQGQQDSTAFQFETQIYIDNKPNYYEFANQTQMMTEAEVMAQFSSPGGVP